MDEPEPDPAIEANVADTVSAVLSEVPNRGTATWAALDRPMAAKTGTTQSGANAWLAGDTPKYTAVVWIGYADGTRTMDTSTASGCRAAPCRPRSGTTSWPRPFPMCRRRRSRSRIPSCSATPPRRPTWPPRPIG